jgi:prepilin-type N-terminal cleavage/methylation domain-containing protein/prepilin-type processing-associated H-X9-DG protein
MIRFAGRRRQAAGAFTLIELLIVLGIISVLLGILIPVLAAARRRSQQAACVSNLHQIGIGIVLYAQDYNDHFPFGGDPEDLHTSGWEHPYGGRFWQAVRSMKPLQKVMQPYTPERLWRCPSDTGFDQSGPLENHPMEAHPTSFRAYGSSYYYYTEVTLRRKTIEDVRVYNPESPHEARGPAEIGLIYDGNGSWHASDRYLDERRNVLYIDGHVTSVWQDVFEADWRFTLVPSDHQ